MKLSRIACLCSLACLALAACGGSSFCDDQAAAMKTLTTTKLAACPNVNASVSLENGQMPTGQGCTDALAKCTSAEQTKLASSVTCLNALGTCTADKDNLSSDYAASLIACSTAGVCATSVTCQAAFKRDTICAMF
jgi:hypothetical protein